MTALADRFPVDEITRQAREARPSRVLLGLLASVLYGIGWVTAKVFKVLWLCAAWCAVAVRSGYRVGAGKSLRAPSLAQLLEENQRLRAELARVT